jgi:hypothetical protein
MPRKIIPATCHPGRPAHLDGLCAVCWFDNREKALATAGPRELTGKEKERRRELVAMHQKVSHLGTLYKEAQAILRENLPRYAELHLTAAEVAAANGDARPSEWALSSARGPKGERIVEPPAKDAGTGGSGVKIVIGINMGAMPEATAEVTEVVESEKVLQLSDQEG